jgi:hypothetical protein
LRAVQAIINDSGQSANLRFSTADFPEAELTQEELDNLMAVLA